MDEQIGKWAHTPDEPKKDHLIESVIADRFVTRCGRQLSMRRNWAVIDKPQDACSHCTIDPFATVR